MARFRICGGGVWPLRGTASPEKFAANSRANLELALYSLRSLQEIGGETGIAYDRATSGVQKIYRSKESLDNADRACDVLAKHRARATSGSTSPARVEIEPALGDTSATLAGALYFERDEVGDCNKFTQGLAAACAARGVRFHYSTTVERRSRRRRGRSTRVETSAGRIPADNVVVALGSFTAPLLAKLGVRVPIYPVKGVSITFPRGAWNSAPRMPVIDDSKLFGLVPIGDRMRISGSAEITGYDATPAPARADAIIANASFTFPELVAPFRPLEGAHLGGAPAGQPGRHADHGAGRPQGALGQCRPRPSRLDACLRLGAGGGGHGLGQEAGDRLAGAAGCSRCRAPPELHLAPPGAKFGSGGSPSLRPPFGFPRASSISNMSRTTDVRHEEGHRADEDWPSSRALLDKP